MGNRKSLVVVLVMTLLLTVWSGSVLASGAVFGGVTKLTGDGSEYFDLGYHLGGKLTAPMGAILSLGGQFTYNRIGLDWAEFGVTGADPDAYFYLAELLAVIVFSTEESAPFAMLGVGGTQVGLGGDDAEGTDSDTNLTLAFGAGVTLELIEVSVVFHMIDASEDQFDDSSNYVTFSGGFAF